MIPLKDNVANFEVPAVMWLLIVLNIGIYFLAIANGPEAYQQILYQFGTVPASFQDPGVIPGAIPAVATLFTAQFLHGGLMHLAGNMYFLYLFGDNVQERFGKPGFLVFYLLTGVIAGLAHLATNVGSEVPAVGASGAISGVLGAYLVMFPKAMIRTLMLLGWYLTVIDIPAVFFLGFWFVAQLFSGLGALIAPESVGIAFWAHVGGFLAGMALAPLWPKDPRVPVEYTELDRLR